MADQYVIYSGGGGGSATTVTANQGIPNTDANGWPVKITDGTFEAGVTGPNSAPGAAQPAVVVSFSPNSPVPPGSNSIGAVQQAGTWVVGQSATATDVAGSWYTRITDGTTIVPVKVGSTAAATGDASFVVALSPNSPLPTGSNAIGSVSVSNFPGTQPISGTVTANQGTGGASAWKVDGSAVTQPISAAALPLPTGAATAAKQPALGTAGTASTDVITIQGIASMVALKTDSSATTQPISGTVAVSTVTSVATINGKTPITLVRNVYSSTNVTTGAYVQLIASTAAVINKIQIFDSSGQTLALAFGAAASEVNKIYIFPGGNGDVDMAIPAGTRVSVIAISATASVGELDINFLG